MTRTKKKIDSEDAVRDLSAVGALLSGGELNADEKRAKAKELVGSLMGDDKPEEFLSLGGLMQQLVGAVVERALEGEMTEHLGYEKGDRSGTASSGNSRNGSSGKCSRASKVKSRFASHGTGTARLSPSW